MKVLNTVDITPQNNPLVELDFKANPPQLCALWNPKTKRFTVYTKIDGKIAYIRYKNCSLRQANSLRYRSKRQKQATHFFNQLARRRAHATH